MHSIIEDLRNQLTVIVISTFQLGNLYFQAEYKSVVQGGDVFRVILWTSLASFISGQILTFSVDLIMNLDMNEPTISSSPLTMQIAALPGTGITSSHRRWYWCLGATYLQAFWPS